MKMSWISELLLSWKPVTSWKGLLEEEGLWQGFQDQSQTRTQQASGVWGLLLPVQGRACLGDIRQCKKMPANSPQRWTLWWAEVLLRPTPHTHTFSLFLFIGQNLPEALVKSLMALFLQLWTFPICQVSTIAQNKPIACFLNGSQLTMVLINEYS